MLLPHTSSIFESKSPRPFKAIGRTIFLHIVSNYVVLKAMLTYSFKLLSLKVCKLVKLVIGVGNNTKIRDIVVSFIPINVVYLHILGYFTNKGLYHQSGDSKRLLFAISSKQPNTPITFTAKLLFKKFKVPFGFSKYISLFGNVILSTKKIHSFHNTIVSFSAVPVTENTYEQ